MELLPPVGWTDVTIKRAESPNIQTPKPSRPTLNFTSNPAAPPVPGTEPQLALLAAKFGTVASKFNKIRPASTSVNSVIVNAIPRITSRPKCAKAPIKAAPIKGSIIVERRS